MSTIGEGSSEVTRPIRGRAGTTAAPRDGQSGGTRTGQPVRSREGSMARTGTPPPDPQDRQPPGRDLPPGQRHGAAGQRPTGPGQPGPGQAPGAQGRRPPGAGEAAPRRRRRGPRRVRLTLQRVDPWSVMKISFLVSVALGIAGVVMVAVLWTVLSGMGVFSDLNGFISDLTAGEGSGDTFDLMDYVGFGRVVSLAVVLGVVDVILLTAMATLGAFLYNICTALVGGAQVTLSDE